MRDDRTIVELNRIASVQGVIPAEQFDLRILRRDLASLPARVSTPAEEFAVLNPKRRRLLV